MGVADPAAGMQRIRRQRFDRIVSACFDDVSVRLPASADRRSYLGAACTQLEKSSAESSSDVHAHDRALFLWQNGRRSPLPDVATLRALSAAGNYDAAILAARLGVSPRHLRRLFLEHLGCSTASWLKEERLQCALSSLVSAKSVKEVAHELAFRSVSQFCRDFRARFGATPSEYLRRQWRHS
jgi:AraC-like DNA-binding protein